MGKPKFQTGDRIVFVDDHKTVWGPWKVVAVCADKVTTLIDQQLEFDLPTEFIHLHRTDMRYPT